MVESILRELELRKDYLAGEVVDTIYWGGGTPSILKVSAIDSMLKAIRKLYNVNEEVEITLEANPDNLTPEKCKELFESGINRLSIGIQSFHNDDLLFMNRSHNAEQAIASVKNAQAAGFKNISIDLIYGLPNQAPLQWNKNLEIAFGLGVDHLSCYALTVEPRTTLADMIRKKKIPELEDEKTLMDFETLMDSAAKEGFEHYEISNFARNKKYSAHNTSYWKGNKYLGVGPSAHSFDGYSRQWNISNNQQYIRALSENSIPFEREVLTEKNKFNEYILTSLRTMWGIDAAYIPEKFGEVAHVMVVSQLNDFVSEGLISKKGENFILTRKGRFLADRIARDLFQ
jgi:oxygen-independent coproporphyrinogen-3 oxidase